MLPQQVWPAVLQDFQSHLPSLQINTIITLVLPYKKLRSRKKSLYSPTPLAPDYPDISKLDGTVLSRGGGASDSPPAVQPQHSQCGAEERSQHGWSQNAEPSSSDHAPGGTVTPAHRHALIALLTREVKRR